MQKKKKKEVRPCTYVNLTQIMESLGGIVKIENIV